MGINERTTDEKELELIVTRFIRKVGVPLHIKGYEYLRTAIMLVMIDYSNFDSVTKVLYPTIAKKYQTTATRVERAIRHAIEISWTRGNLFSLYEMLGDSGQVYDGRPTNSEFIALAADNIRLKHLK